MDYFIDGHPREKLELRNLCYGDLFMFNNQVYMKIEEVSKNNVNDFNVVNIEDGQVLHFPQTLSVKKYTAGIRFLMQYFSDVEED